MAYSKPLSRIYENVPPRISPPLALEQPVT